MSGVGSPIQNDFYVIGSATTAATLTALFADNTKIFNIEGINQIVFDVEYTPAAANRTISLQYEFSTDNSTFFHRTVVKISSTERTLTIPPTIFLGALAGTAYKFEDAVNVANRWMRVSVKEDGSSSFGTVTLKTMVTDNL